mmetsp:Transcript_6841/g.9994  ORF Transcript_6841/g.9994 Transcript_6841/m.9994 type:complete len:382 (-) Transcript_6841:148-1293(-)|eukprot:CAMPEP_0194213654 /NCGR_PEP_ID=MMETSP0156-20130528/14395_1 /TAXON_ID=33649 /ORGANISM="Thalassionema nitzschioides, Strain L26-B" /LENGTH=381 /DNA_ID=CAMNT_0038941735 /DNA_START=235 /DNA_END=1380 /DNA_ORIENTATION=+
MKRRYQLCFQLLALTFASWAWTPSVSRVNSGQRFSPRQILYEKKLSSNKFSKTICLVQSNGVDEHDQLPASLSDDHIITEDQLSSFFNNIDNSLMKTINAIFLLASFGFSIYTMLNIDHDITRGWTQAEIAMRVPLDNWASYESSLAQSPMMTKTTINVIVYSLGDWLSQTVFQQKNVLEFDVVRTIRNGFIGLCFGPAVHAYYEWSDHILPVEGGLVNRLEKILMDQTLYLTVKCSIYIAAVGLLQGDSFETAINSVKTRIRPICFTAWKFWPLIHCITYSVIPNRHRMLWVNSVDLVWNAILASMSRSEESIDEQAEKDSKVALETNSDVLEVKAVQMPMIYATEGVDLTKDDQSAFTTYNVSEVTVTVQNVTSPVMAP